MLLHPSYDTQAREWFVEHEGLLFAAPTLAQLKTKFADDVLFEGYYPNGFVAERPGFLQPSNRKVVISYHKKIQPVVVPAAKPIEPKPEPKVEVTPRSKPIPPAPRLQTPQQASLERVRYRTREKERQIHIKGKKGSFKRVDRDEVLNRIAKGYKRLQIANELDCSIFTVSAIRTAAKEANDPRANGKPVTPRVVLVRDKKPKWTQEQDKELRHLAEVEKLTSPEIGKRMGRTKNAIIGRCHRKNIQLQSKSVADPNYWKERNVGRSQNAPDLERHRPLQSKALEQG